MPLLDDRAPRLLAADTPLGRIAAGAALLLLWAGFTAAGFVIGHAIQVSAHEPAPALEVAALHPSAGPRRPSPPAEAPEPGARRLGPGAGEAVDPARTGSAPRTGTEPAPEPEAPAPGETDVTEERLAELAFSPGARITGRLPRGGTLSAELRRKGVPPATVERIIAEVGALFDFRYARPGDRYTLVRERDGTVLEFRYQYSPVASVRMTRAGDGYHVEREEIELIRQRARVAGVISSTLYDAILDQGESPQLARDFVDIFAWDVDFSRAVQPGDEFGILYERFYREENGREVFVRAGRILAARYSGTAGAHAAVWFETEPGRGGYYRPDGSSVQRQFLRAPLEYSRISSRYSNARRHPILNVTRPHHGIDYAAPAGTPLWAVADGVVTHRGWAGGFGRLVKIRHPNGYESYYGHLSRFGGGIHVGQHVEQKQIIGYVGKSGLATGPHVCFRVARDGRFVNPTKLRTPAAPPVPEERREAFAAVRDELLPELVSAPGQLATLEAL